MNLRTAVLTILIIGLGLFFYSLTLPYYKNKEAAEKLASNSYDFDKEVYYKEEAALRTGKVIYMDLGAGLSVASTAILLFLIGSKVRSSYDLKRVRSLNKISIVISSNLVWLLLIPGTYWYYGFRGARGDYPPFADSIAIPIFTQIPVYLYALIPMNIFVLLTLIKSNLPTNIFIKAIQYSKFKIFWEIFFGFWIMTNLLFMLSFVADGDHISILVNLFFLYLLLTLRAGQISRTTSLLADA